jgi:hypothetical protein
MSLYLYYMKITLTESQFKRIILESFITSDSAIKKSIGAGLKLKAYSLDNPPPTKSKDIYPKGAPELVSAVSTHGKVEIEENLIKVAKTIREKTGLVLELTGGDDYFHRVHGGRHKDGQALDFVITPSTNIDQERVERVILDIILSGTYPHLGFINEYKRPSGKATAGHFHISFGSPTENTYFHFMKDSSGGKLIGGGSRIDGKYEELKKEYEELKKERRDFLLKKKKEYQSMTTDGETPDYRKNRWFDR